MKRYSRNEKSYIYTAFPKEKENDVLKCLENLNNDGIEFWYNDTFNKREIKRIEASFGVLVFLTNKYSKTKEFHEIIDNAVKNSKNILCVYLEDVDENPWISMQLSSQQSLKTKEFDEDFIHKLKGSFIFKNMKVTSTQMKFQRNRTLKLAIVLAAVVLVLFVTVINPLLIVPAQEKEEITKKWGISTSTLEKITEIHIVGNQRFDSDVDAEYVDGNKTTVSYKVFGMNSDGTKKDYGTTSIGTLTSDDLKIVKYMPNLRVLDIQAQQITDISPLFESNIEVLKLSCNPISSIEGIGSIKNLKKLVLNFTDISDLSPIVDLDKLTYLEVNDTKVTNLDATENLVNLTVLRARDNKIEKITKLPTIDEKTKFELEITNNPLTDISGLSNIKYYGSLCIGNYTGSSSFDKKLNDALKDSSLDMLAYSGCVSVENIKDINIKKWGLLDLCCNSFVTMNGIENFSEISTLDLTRIVGKFETIVDLTGLLKVDFLKTVYLSPDLKQLAKSQLKDAKFTIDYRWKDEQ